MASKKPWHPLFTPGISLSIEKCIIHYYIKQIEIKQQGHAVAYRVSPGGFTALQSLCVGSLLLRN